jgi:hypothetical protein
MKDRNCRTTEPTLDITSASTQIGEGWAELFKHLFERGDLEGADIADSIMGAYTEVLRDWERRLGRLLTNGSHE